MNIFLIADSGSTKTDWCVVREGKEYLRIQTKGMNPFFQTKEEMGEELRNHLFPHLLSGLFSYRDTLFIESIYFYGAGCTPENKAAVEKVLKETFEREEAFKTKEMSGIKIEAESDLLGAARALCKDQPGIACILGTGSNSCFYDGERIADTVPSLGYVLGDEGSGANIGKRFLADCLKKQLPPDVTNAFFRETGLCQAGILQRVYRSPFPNRFLASMAPFVKKQIGNESVCKIVKTAFREFIRRNLHRYDYKSYPVHAVGSIAWNFKDLWREEAEKEGLILGTVCQSPMKRLAEYHNR